MKRSPPIEGFSRHISRAIAEDYASLDYVTACEQFLFSKHLKPGMTIPDDGVGGGRTTPHPVSRLKSNFTRVPGEIIPDKERTGL